MYFAHFLFCLLVVSRAWANPAPVPAPAASGDLELEKVFRTPKDPDHLEILERGNFLGDGIVEYPGRAVANAQVLLGGGCGYNPRVVVEETAPLIAGGLGGLIAPGLGLGGLGAAGLLGYDGIGGLGRYPYGLWPGAEIIGGIGHPGHGHCETRIIPTVQIQETIVQDIAPEVIKVPAPCGPGPVVVAQPEVVRVGGCGGLGYDGLLGPLGGLGGLGGLVGPLGYDGLVGAVGYDGLVGPLGGVVGPLGLGGPLGGLVGPLGYDGLVGPYGGVAGPLGLDVLGGPLGGIVGPLGIDGLGGWLNPYLSGVAGPVVDTIFPGGVVETGLGNPLLNGVATGGIIGAGPLDALNPLYSPLIAEIAGAPQTPIIVGGHRSTSESFFSSALPTEQTSVVYKEPTITEIVKVSRPTVAISEATELVEPLPTAVPICNTPEVLGGWGAGWPALDGLIGAGPIVEGVIGGGWPYGVGPVLGGGLVEGGLIGGGLIGGGLIGGGLIGGGWPYGGGWPLGAGWGCGGWPVEVPACLPRNPCSPWY